MISGGGKKEKRGEAGEECLYPCEVFIGPERGKRGEQGRFFFVLKGITRPASEEERRAERKGRVES